MFHLNSPTRLESLNFDVPFTLQFLPTEIIPKLKSCELSKDGQPATCTVMWRQHFNSTGHSISDTQVRDMHLCNETNMQRKHGEMKIIFQLGSACSAEWTQY